MASLDADLSTVAYHEAGHAVCAFALHLRIQQVTIVPGEDCVAHLEIAQGRDLWWWRRVIVVLLAGDISQLHHDPERRRRGNADDLLKAEDIIDRFFARPDRKKWLAALAHEAEDIIDRWWPKVEAVAEALMQRRMMTGKEVTACILKTGADAEHSAPTPAETMRDAFQR